MRFPPWGVAWPPISGHWLICKPVLLTMSHDDHRVESPLCGIRLFS